jgi:hypothetical protein
MGVVTHGTWRRTAVNRLKFVSQRARKSGEIAADSPCSDECSEEQCTYRPCAKLCDLDRRSTNWRTASFTASLALACLLLLSACSSVQVHLGKKVALDKIPVQSMSVSLLNGPGLGPGQKGQLVVLVTGRMEKYSGQRARTGRFSGRISRLRRPSLLPMRRE